MRILMLVKRLKRARNRLRTEIRSTPHHQGSASPADLWPSQCHEPTRAGVVPTYPCLAQTGSGSDKFFPTSCRDGLLRDLIRSLSLGENYQSISCREVVSPMRNACHRVRLILHIDPCLYFLSSIRATYLVCSPARSLNTRHTRMTVFSCRGNLHAMAGQIRLPRSPDAAPKLMFGRVHGRVEHVVLRLTCSARFLR